MGAVMATLLWKTSQSIETIHTYIESGNLNQFLNLANSTIFAFRETYGKDQLPNDESYEFKYITSLFGVCINISAQKIGREYLLEREIAEEFTTNIAAFLGEIPMPIGNRVKRLVLMLLYNLTFVRQGTVIIQNSNNIIDYTMDCFDSNHTTEIKSIAVSLINVLINDPPETFSCSKVKQKVNFILILKGRKFLI